MLKPSPLRIPWIHRGWTLVVLVRSYKNNVALWYKDAAKEPSNGGQHGEDLHSHHDLALGAVADREEGEQTLRSTSMLKVRKLASLKVSGTFLARKAKKVPRAKEPR